MSRFASLILNPNSYSAEKSITVTLAVQNFEDKTTTGAADSKTIWVKSMKIQFDYINFQFSYLPLVTTIENQVRSIGVDEDLTIDASAFYNPNNESALLEHYWTCIDVTLQKNCKIFETQSSEILRIPPDYLNESHR